MSFSPPKKEKFPKRKTLINGFPELIPLKVFAKAKNLAPGIDIDDTE
jgi:hypothetical protein